jgi:hypothetical protein
VLLALASAQHLVVEQLDVRTAFLNGDLTEDVYLKLPPELGGNVWLLHKALYGLKQAARAWHDKLRREMLNHGFKPSRHEPCLFIRGEGANKVFVVVHVDDALVVGEAPAVKDAKRLIGSVFDIKDMGHASYYLGMHIKKNADGGYSLLQPKYVADLLLRFNMTDCKPCSTPLPIGTQLSKFEGAPLSPDNQYAALIGSLIYLAVNTRPDISHAVGILSRFMSCPTDTHWEAGKHILRYLKATSDMGLTYSGTTNDVHQGVYACTMYTDADFAADVDRRRSTTGGVMLMQNAAVVWLSKLQSIVATSTAEAEYIAAATATKEGLWVRKLLGEVHGSVSPLNLVVDNQSAVVLISQHTAGRSDRTNYIDVQHHFVRDRFQRGDVSVQFVPTEDQHADMFTKQLPGPSFRKHRSVVMGM